ncbi:DUF2798 domain-containing protein [Pelagicoccus albus]|uniref:DUF2798 domain-containing protein n=1 Tax=Pelagicoccus albus TaxID=415222 RepID=A0A7X1E9J0_9BACT|nr:DUF2798 domain-containing protein [Pelagicoccus albus]MBC2607474.1 DUF2798 domain-containing protein [Pelagicoccus albus]
MGSTPFQRTVFTVVICFFMVLGMTAYNILLAEGYSEEFPSILFKEFWLGFAIALTIDLLLVSKVAKPLAFRMISKYQIQRLPAKVIIISTSMVVGMVICMSLYGSVLAVGFTPAITSVYFRIVLLNFVVAWPLNLILVNPLARLIHLGLFPQSQERA